MKLIRFLLRYYPPGIILEYQKSSGEPETKSIDLLKQRMEWETAAHRMEEFNAMTEDPDLWNDPAHAQKVMRERQKLADGIDGYKELAQGLSDNVELIEMGEMEGDEEIVTEAEQALQEIKEIAAAKETEALLSGEMDGNDAFLEVHSGAGGTESCDWANMLLRMYKFDEFVSKQPNASPLLASWKTKRRALLRP